MTQKRSDDTEVEHALKTFGRGVRTALGNNATAYGFSISITVSYGLLSGPRGVVAAHDTILFAIGAAAAFAIVGLVFMSISPEGSLWESGQIETISGVVDVVSVAATVAVAFGLSQIPGVWGWPLTGAGATTTYLLVGGLDVLVARVAARHSNFGASQ